jgi:hypothetical protein
VPVVPPAPPLPPPLQLPARPPHHPPATSSHRLISSAVLLHFQCGDLAAQRANISSLGCMPDILVASQVGLAGCTCCYLRYLISQVRLCHLCWLACPGLYRLRWVVEEDMARLLAVFERAVACFAAAPPGPGPRGVLCPGGRRRMQVASAAHAGDSKRHVAKRPGHSVLNEAMRSRFGGQSKAQLATCSPLHASSFLLAVVSCAGLGSG